MPVKLWLFRGYFYELAVLKPSHADMGLRVYIPFVASRRNFVGFHTQSTPEHVAELELSHLHRCV